MGLYVKVTFKVDTLGFHILMKAYIQFESVTSVYYFYIIVFASKWMITTSTLE